MRDGNNNQLLIEVICHPTKENRDKLDHLFKEYNFNARFTAFISSTLYFNAINYDKRHRRDNGRFLLTMDRPLNGEEYTSFKDLVEDENSEVHLNEIFNSRNIEDYIEDPVLYKAVTQLSIKQKEVIHLYYVTGLTDTEISKVLNKSQQAISKLHQKALKSISNFIQSNGGE